MPKWLADAQVVKGGQGPPLVYLHGAFGYQKWQPFLDRLAHRFTVYAPVHPGFSETNGIESIDDVLDLALYHFDLLDALGPAVLAPDGTLLRCDDRGRDDGTMLTSR